jgi:hypothetical protein
MLGVPFSCLYNQIIAVASLWKTSVAQATLADFVGVLAIDTVSITGFRFTKRADLVLTVSTTAGLTASDVAAKFSAWSNLNVVAIVDADAKTVTIRVPETENVDISDRSIAPVTALSAAFALLGAFISLYF